jgi:hypothetical protein
MTDTIDDVAAAAQEEPAAVSGPGAHPPKAGAVLPTHFRTAIQQDSLTPATSSKSPDVPTASSDPATQVGTAVDAGQRSTRLRVPSSGVWSSVSSTRLPPGLGVDPAGDRLCPRTRPDSGRLHRLRRGGRTPKRHRGRDQRRDRFPSGRGGRCDRLIVGRSCRTGWTWRQGPVAAPHRVREQHALVAAVLRHRRLGRRRNRGHRDNSRRRLRLTRPAIMPSRAAIRVKRRIRADNVANLPVLTATGPVIIVMSALRFHPALRPGRSPSSGWPFAQGGNKRGP